MLSRGNLSIKHEPAQSRQTTAFYQLNAPPMYFSSLKAEPPKSPSFRKGSLNSFLKYCQSRRLDLAQFIEYYFTPIEESVFTVLDLETTGLDTQTNEILEITALKIQDDKILGTFSTLVKPIDSIPLESTRFHGITDKMIEEANAPEAPVALQQLYDFIGKDSRILGEAIHFDMKTLEQHVQRLQLSHLKDRLNPKKTICTFRLGLHNVPEALPLARKKHKEDPSYLMLDAFQEIFGLEKKNRHRSEGDALLTADVFRAILHRTRSNGYPLKTVADLYRHQKKHCSI